MKTMLYLVTAASLGFAIGYLIVSKDLRQKYAEELARHQAAWQSEKEQLLAERDQARRNRPVTIMAPRTTAAPSSAPATKPSPQEILEKLKTLGATPGPDRSAVLRQIMQQLENLIECGPAALPVIRDFLARNEDIEFLALSAPDKGKGGPPPRPDSPLPASLRLGLFDVVRRIGGEQAEQMLSETLRSTGRGPEVLTLARYLEQMAPGKYRDAALASARELLASPPAFAAASPLDQHSRDYLFEVLRVFNDNSYVAQAQAQLVQADGRLDVQALDYLRRTLREQSLPLIAQTLKDPRITDAKQKEELVKVALDFVGTDTKANALWYEVVSNPNLPDNLREKALKDLDGPGFENKNSPTARDLQLAQSRLQLLEALQPEVQDPVKLATIDKTRAKLSGMLDPNPRPTQAPKVKAPKGK